MSWSDLFKELCKDLWRPIDRFLDWFLDVGSKKIYQDLKDFILFMVFLMIIIAFSMVIYTAIKL